MCECVCVYQCVDAFVNETDRKGKLCYYLTWTSVLLFFFNPLQDCGKLQLTLLAGFFSLHIAAGRGNKLDGRVQQRTSRGTLKAVVFLIPLLLSLPG